MSAWVGEQGGWQPRAHDPACFEHVPAEVFANRFDETITTPLGHNLACVVTESDVDIYDPSQIINPGHAPDIPDDPTYRFTAGLRVARSSLVFSLYVRNRDPLSAAPTDRHPAIRPACLAIRALDYFVAQGNYVQYMSGHWQELRHGLPVAADNWDQYQRNLQQGRRWWHRPTFEEVKAAVQNTHAGRLAARLGFGEVLSVATEDDGKTICPMFVRPAAEAQAHRDALRRSSERAAKYRP